MRTSRLVKDENDYIEFFVGIRWPRGPRCLECDSKDVTLLKTRAIFQCNYCRKQFAVFKKTRFDGMRFSPSQLFQAAAGYYSNAGQMTVRELKRSLGTPSYSSAYRLLQNFKQLHINLAAASFNEFIQKLLL